MHTVSLRQGVYCTIRQEGARRAAFRDSFCAALRQTTSSLRRCQATFSSRYWKPDPSKTNTPSCSHNSSRSSGGKRLRRAPRLGGAYGGRACVCASRSLYSFPNHQRPLGAAADTKGGKRLEDSTSRLRVESGWK